ncbi:MAG: hypothetical protein ACLVKO_03660 [Dysgonomonas sp.]
MPVGTNIFKLNAGLRGMSMINMDSRYEMNGKLYFDPRINAEWSFPGIEIKKKNLNISVSGGIGWHTKFPTLDQIYPDYTYRDEMRLNYYLEGFPESSYVVYETFKTKTVNYNLEPARNKKWEIRLNVEYDNNTLSVTYFKENMANGFRSQVMNFRSKSVRKYNSDINSLVIDPITNRPDWELSEYQLLDKLYMNSATGNGTSLIKEGIEFTLSTKRLEYLKTRLTATGAWFKTKYLNSAPEYKGTSKSTNGEPIQEIGVYDSSGGYYREEFNTRFMFDTYIPSIGFEFSSTFQCQWFYIEQTLPVTRYPYAYIDKYGVQHPYTQASKEDPVLQFLNRESNPGAFKKGRIPFGMDINLKASKKIKDIMRISLFVNKLLDYYPKYKVNGVVIKRNVSPYFGMEMTFTL